MPFNIISSCILGFQATGPPTWAHFIHPLFTVCWRITKYKCISEPNNSGLQTQQCPIGQAEGNPCRARFLTHWKNGNLNFSESSEEGRPVHSLRSSSLYKARVNKHGNNVKWFWNTHLSYFPQIYLWIPDKYSSTRFTPCEWQRKILQHNFDHLVD